MSAFKVTVSFPKGSNEGTLVYEGANGPISATCWWDRSRIDDGTYERCSRTNMAESGHDSIHVAKAKVNGLEVNNRFIHHGSSTENSWGCIAAETAKIQLILPNIPKDAFNVTVVIATST
jgi:hypothetical protein